MSPQILEYRRVSPLAPPTGDTWTIGAIEDTAKRAKRLVTETDCAIIRPTR